MAKKATVKKTSVKVPKSLAKEIKDIGTDIGEEPKAIPDIKITGEQEAPTWLTNLLAIYTHALSLVEAQLHKNLYGEIWTILPGGRKFSIIIEKDANAKVG